MGAAGWERLTGDGCGNELFSCTLSCRPSSERWVKRSRGSPCWRTLRKNERDQVSYLSSKSRMERLRGGLRGASSFSQLGWTGWTRRRAVSAGSKSGTGAQVGAAPFRWSDEALRLCARLHRQQDRSRFEAAPGAVRPSPAQPTPVVRQPRPTYFFCGASSLSPFRKTA